MKYQELRGLIMAKRITKKKTTKKTKKTAPVSAADVLEFLKSNPEIAQALGLNKTPEVDTEDREYQSNRTAPKIVKSKGKPQYKPEKPIKFFDDPSIGQAEREFDKKLYEKYTEASPRREPFQKYLVKCERCGKDEQISPALYSSEHSYYCEKCIGGSKGRGPRK